MEIGKEILQVSISKIVPNSYQPRIVFDEEGVKSLADSIKQHGIIQPLILRKKGEQFEIIAGERRYQAAKMVGLTTVPAILTMADDTVSAEIAVVENTQRKELNAIEEAKAYEKILSLGQTTQEQLATRMGVSQPTIANKLRLLGLDASVQNALLNNQISERHARSLLRVKDLEKQRETLNKIITERMTVKETENYIKANFNGDDSIPQEETIEEAKVLSDADDIISNINNINLPLSPDVGTNIESAFSDLNLVNTDSPMFNDNEIKVEDTPQIPTPIDVNQIKNQAQDINNLFKSTNATTFTPSEPEELNDKFFKSLENEKTNMDFSFPTFEAKNVESTLPQAILEQETPPLPDGLQESPTNQEEGVMPMVDNTIPFGGIPEPIIPQVETPEPTLQVPQIEENILVSTPISEEPIQTPVVEPEISVSNFETPAIQENPLGNIMNENIASDTVQINPDITPVPSIPMESVNSNINPIFDNNIIDQGASNTSIIEQNINPVPVEAITLPPEPIIDEPQIVPEPVLPPQQNTFNSEDIFPTLTLIDDTPVKPEPSPSSIFRVKNAIGLIRNLTVQLEASGYRLESEELDLEDEYHIIIKFPKNQ